jgi:hypothetical protein
LKSDIRGCFYDKPSVNTKYETSEYLWSIGLGVLASPSKSFYIAGFQAIALLAKIG